MKRLYLLLILFLFTPVLIFSQKLKWVKGDQFAANLIDENQNIYVVREAYVIVDIDPGPDTVNIKGLYFAKYDSSFNLKWVQPDPMPQYSYNAIKMTETNDGKLILVYGSYDNTWKGIRYNINEYLQDGTKLYQKKASSFNIGMGGYYLDVLDVYLDSASNIWISFNANIDEFMFGEEDVIETNSPLSTFLAKYDKDGNFVKVIKIPADDKYKISYRRTNFKLDTSGTIHQLISKDNAYYYRTLNLKGEEKLNKLVDIQNDNAIFSHLIIDENGELIVCGRFNDVIDFGNSEENMFLTPKGDWDAFIAKYTPNGELINAWQIGGSGNVYIGEDYVMKNNLIQHSYSFAFAIHN